MELLIQTKYEMLISKALFANIFFKFKFQWNLTAAGDML